MNADTDIYQNKDLFAPVVFRTDFNEFAPINSNQAWSLFFTAGQEDKQLGNSPELGRFFTNTLLAIGAATFIWGYFFSRWADFF
ncbi:hypothetical protein IQ225_16760 [Synechocystis salina LEGE 06155]|nr:hypothetical protein [Synechocystis salina LEGE 06155]